MIGAGKTSPYQAAFYNGALVRYLDFNDSYLAKGETCHPSDNLGAVCASSEYANGSGKDIITALAVAYQVQCRLSDVAPVRNRGFDHTTQGAYAVAAGVSKALSLNEEQALNAFAMCGTALNALRVTRTGTLSHWKGLAYPFTAWAATYLTFLAMRGITGPEMVFEGNKGFMESIAGKFEIDWSDEDLESVTRTVLKKYNAEVHSQSAIEGVLELKKEHDIKVQDIKGIEIETFDVAYNIIGGGEEGEKKAVRTKEEADHSLPYIIAVSLIDDQVMPEQYFQTRILNSDVQSLMQRVSVHPREEYSARFPDQMPCKIKVSLANGKTCTKEKSDYEGYVSSPADWNAALDKFHSLAKGTFTDEKLDTIASFVENLEHMSARDFMSVLAATF
jgi:2-methylcitrate dehydratase